MSQVAMNQLIENVALVIDENDITPMKRARLKKKLRKLDKKGRLDFKADSLWIWRLCAAALMRGDFSHWYGFELRSKWAANFALYDWIYPRWNGKNQKCIVLAEQGAGDEIIFASVFEQFLNDCPDAILECDSRLIPIFERSFPGANFKSRWVNDKIGNPQHPENYKPDEYESFVPMGDLLKVYTMGKGPKGEAYLKPDPKKVEKKKRYLDRLSHEKKIGLSWMGGRSYLDPEQIKKQDGMYIGLQYKKEGDKVVTDTGPDWVHDCGVDHNDFDDLFALVAALDEINTVQSVVAHIAGSQGKNCNVIKPPPQFAKDGNPDNNRLKWYYGIGGDKWTMPWYNSNTVFENWKTFQNN
jgi:hypothetical protein